MRYNATTYAAYNISCLLVLILCKFWRFRQQQHLYLSLSLSLAQYISISLTHTYNNAYTLWRYWKLNQKIINSNYVYYDGMRLISCGNLTNTSFWIDNTIGNNISFQHFVHQNNLQRWNLYNLIICCAIKLQI